MILTQPRQSAAEALDSLEGSLLKLDTVQWLERQLRGLVSQLDAMLLDLASGLSIFDLGFGEDDFAEFVEDLERQVGNLLSLIQQAKQRER